MVIVRTLGGGDIAFEDNHALFLGALADLAGAAEVRGRHAAVVRGARRFRRGRQQPRDHPLRRRRASVPTSTSSAPRPPRREPKKRCAPTPTTKKPQAALARADVRLEVALSL